MNPQAQSGGDGDDRTLWCGSLHDNVTEEILYELFLQVGPVEKVKLIPSKDGKQSYAFVTFEHAVSVAFAKELMNGIKLYGKPIKLQLRSKAKGVSMSEIKLKEYLMLNNELKFAYDCKVAPYNHLSPPHQEVGHRPFKMPQPAPTPFVNNVPFALIPNGARPWNPQMPNVMFGHNPILHNGFRPLVNFNNFSH